MDELEENEIDFTDWDDDVGEVKDFDSDDSERHFRSKDHDNVKDTKNAQNEKPKRKRRRRK